MMNKNEIIQYKNKVDNEKDKLIWCAIKNKLPIYLKSITDDKINKDIKSSLNSGYDFLCYYIDNELETYTDGFGIKQTIKDYYNEFKNEFSNIDIRDVIYHFKLTAEWMNKIKELDCVKNFGKRFLDNGFRISIILSEEDQQIKIKVYLLDEK